MNSKRARPSLNNLNLNTMEGRVVYSLKRQRDAEAAFDLGVLTTTELCDYATRSFCDQLEHIGYLNMHPDVEALSMRVAQFQAEVQADRMVKEWKEHARDFEQQMRDLYLQRSFAVVAVIQNSAVELQNSVVELQNSVANLVRNVTTHQRNQEIRRRNSLTRQANAPVLMLFNAQGLVIPLQPPLTHGRLQRINRQTIVQILQFHGENTVGTTIEMREQLFAFLGVRHVHYH